MKHVAIVDTTHHTDSAPPDMVVAGLTLVERATRMASVSGAERVLLVGAEGATTEAPVFDTIEDALSTVESDEVVAVLSSSTVYNRGLYRDAVDAFDDDALEVGTDAGDAHIRIWRGPEQPDAFDLHHDERWFVDVATVEHGKQAADRLWNDCRKDLDGIVAKLINRNISIACSRVLAPTWVKPNHISVVTFSLGIIAALLAAWGGWFGFALAGLVFQANSIIDGIDGELARVRYEFSLLGEWLDTLSDDFSDVFFWAGLGVGAWRTFPTDIMGFGPEIWLWLGGISVAFKLLSMALYYTWLVAHGRGDLLAFTWAFDDQDAKDQSAVMKVLGNLKYVTKKDFIVFSAMILGFVNLLPYLLVAAAPGNIVVAAGVTIQRLAQRDET